jgi:hypothetical protein
MTGTPRCDYIPMWSGNEHRCTNEARLRVFKRHAAGVNPVYKDRCLVHASGAFGPGIAAYWDSNLNEWRPTD